MNTLAQGFELDGLRVSPSTGEVSGPGGTAKLDPRVMDVLVLMAAHPGEVMTRESLVSRLWGHAVVTDDALTRCFYELRRHLVQAGGGDRYRALIETLPKRGYRLNGTVSPGLPPPARPAPPPRQSRRRHGRPGRPPSSRSQRPSRSPASGPTCWGGSRARRQAVQRR
jgi:DNA-binding winged helix-turn-helix (wHTH) protein